MTTKDVITEIVGNINSFRSLYPHSTLHGRLAVRSNWRNPTPYGIMVSDNHFFDFTDFQVHENPKGLYLINDVILLPANEVIERLRHALRCFREWQYGMYKSAAGWNAEHFARLVATNVAISYWAKNTFPQFITPRCAGGINLDAQPTLDAYLHKKTQKQAERDQLQRLSRELQIREQQLQQSLNELQTHVAILQIADGGQQEELEALRTEYELLLGDYEGLQAEHNQLQGVAISTRQMLEFFRQLNRDLVERHYPRGMDEQGRNDYIRRLYQRIQVLTDRVIELATPQNVQRMVHH